MTDSAIPKAPNGEQASNARRRQGLLKTGALHNAILNSAGFASIATDEKGIIQIFNPGARRMLGYSAAEVLNKFTPADFSDPLETAGRARALSLEFATAIAPGFEALVFKASRGIEDRYELTCLRKDGSRLAALVAVTALHDPRGEIVGYLLIFTDNSARKQSEEQLRRAEEDFRLTVESVSDCAIVQLDAQGQVLSWNTGAQVIDGYSAHEMVGQHFSRLYSREDIEGGVPQRALEAAAATGRYETQGPKARKDGSTYRAHIVLTPVHDEAGVLRGFARLTWDATRNLSQPGQPAAQLPKAKSEAALQPPAPAGVARRALLYVEDDGVSLGLVEQFLTRRTDLLLLRAADMKLGLELARSARPEVILLNIDLPGMSALEFMKALRADPATQTTPVLALSANSAPDAIVKGLQAGFFHYLTKPTKAEPLLEAVTYALEFAALERAEENHLPSRASPQPLEESR
jgi:PAS domain S-box-containing protein